MPVRTQREWLEPLAIVLLLVGGFLAGVGWLAGVVLLWLSNVWTTRDKLIGTLIVPGGLALPLFVFSVVAVTGGSSGTTLCSSVARTSSAPGSFSTTTTSCTNTGSGGSSHIVAWGVLVALVVLPVLSAAYLARRSRRFELA
jgi:hypothetical protein